MRSLLNNFWPFFIIVIVVGATYFFIPNREPALIETIPENKKLAISIINEVNKFLVSIAFIIIGFFGNAIFGKIEVQLTNRLNTIFFISSIFSLISIYVGYELYNSIIEGLINGVVDLDSSYIIYLRKFQFISVIISAFTFLIFTKLYSSNSFFKEKS